MIILENVQQLDGSCGDVSLASRWDLTINASGLTLFPGLIDPHVHFRIPGQGYKEDWQHAALASIRGGYTCVFDMPNNVPACVSAERLTEKKALITAQLADVNIPLRYGLYLGADKHHFHEVAASKEQVIGIKVFMGSSTGELLMDDSSSLHAIFALASAHGLVVAVHAEDECMIAQRRELFAGATEFVTHAKIRDPAVAVAAVTQAVELAALYGTTLYVLHVSTADELAVIAAAKQAGVAVFAETTPHHLFLSVDDYPALRGRAQVNPPLRDPKHHQALWQAIHTGVIDTIGSDHAPHTQAEKDQDYGQVPSGMPGIETNVALLLHAYNQGLLSLAEIERLTYSNARRIFNLPVRENDAVLVDLNLQKTVSNDQLATKCQWSAFAGRSLTGWPVCTIIDGQVFDFR